MLSSTATTVLLRVSATLWVVWGLVHILAGGLTMGRDTAEAVAGIADAVDPTVLAMVYPEAVGAVVNQHGFNLFWIGVATTVGAVYIWRRSATAIFVTALIGGLADVGYFVFMDLGGFVNFVPGTLMTVVSGSATAMTFLAYFTGWTDTSD